MKHHSKFFHIFIILISLAFFFIQSGNYGLRLNSQLADFGDSILNAWILAWDTHALLNSEVSIWDAPIFFPVRNALAFSENLFGNLWVSLPIQLLTNNHILAANSLALVSFVLSSYFVFLLVTELTGNRWSGLSAGLIFSFNPYRWVHLVHLQLMPFFWAPLAILFTNRFVYKKNIHDFWIALFFTWLQYYASVYLGTMLLTLLITLFLVHLSIELKGYERIDYFRDKKIIISFFLGALLSALILLPLSTPYLKVALKWIFFRTIKENANFSADLFSFLLPSYVHSNYGWLKSSIFKHVTTDKGESAIFFGFLPYFLAALSIFFVKKKYHYFSAYQKKLILRYTILSIAMALITLGPFISIPLLNKNIPMPFLIVFKLIPGGSAMRVPARFAFPFLLTLSVLCGFGVLLIIKKLQKYYNFLRHGILTLLVIFFIFEYQIDGVGRGDLKLRKKFPKVYRYLKNSPQKYPVLEIPINRILKFNI